MLTVKQAEFLEEAINDLFKYGEPYIVVQCQEDYGYRPEITVCDFEKADGYTLDGSDQDYISWNDDDGRWSSLDDVQVIFRPDQRAIQIWGKTGTGAIAWRTMRSINNDNYEAFARWQQAWWKLPA